MGSYIVNNVCSYVTIHYIIITYVCVTQHEKMHSYGHMNFDHIFVRITFCVTTLLKLGIAICSGGNSIRCHVFSDQEV